MDAELAFGRLRPVFDLGQKLRLDPDPPYARCAWCKAAFSGSAASSASKSAADAKLSNFDSQHRAPGSFYVIFKTPAELAVIPRTGPNAPKVLPQLALTSMDAAWHLAAALCIQIHAQLAGVNYVPPHVAFITRGASDAAMREVLAKDPRIAEISANIEVSVN